MPDEVRKLCFFGLYIFFLAHRDDLVGDIVLVEFLHVQQQLVGVRQEGLLRSTKPIAYLKRPKQAATRRKSGMCDSCVSLTGRIVVFVLTRYSGPHQSINASCRRNG